MKKTAIILGATGLTGGLLLETLLKDDDFGKVKLFSRRSTTNVDEKIEEHIVDLFLLEEHAEVFTADVVFCCIGTTKAHTPDKEVYRKIDYGIPVSAAKLAKKNGVDSFVVISAMGARIESTVFYNKTKGEMERDVLAQEMPNTYILQPSLIGGVRKERRMGESLAKFFMSVFGFLIPKEYKTIPPETIVKAMVVLAKKGYSERRISSATIKIIAHES
ncbi:MAG: NAD(P)H-binding protein [Bacteroidetes bacterium]|nr:NAD(P)H-binding protein [Bacteroidota bacterium]